MSDRAPFLVDDADVPLLREAVSAIAATGYCEAAVQDRLGLRDLCDLDWRSLPLTAMSAWPRAMPWRWPSTCFCCKEP